VPLGIGPHLVLPYALENETVNQQLELAFGKSSRLFNMDKVSNGPFTDVRVLALFHEYLNLFTL
jgi:hypothetical protein